MPEYQLYCFAQSGNAYRAALMLNLIGADWKPVYVDFFRAARRARRSIAATSTKWAKCRCWSHGEKKLTQSGVILTYLARRTRQIPAAGRGRGARGAALDHLRQPEGQRLPRALPLPEELRASRRAIPAVLAFLKGRIDGNLAIINKRLARPPFLLGERPTIADVSLCAICYYPAEEFGFDIRKDHPAIRRLARPHQGAARLGASLRADAGLSVRHQSAERQSRRLIQARGAVVIGRV